MYKKLTPILMLFLLLITNQAQTTIYSTFGPENSWDVDSEGADASGSVHISYYFSVEDPGYTNITIEAAVYYSLDGSCSIEVYSDDGSNRPTGSPLASGTMTVTTSDEIQSTNFSSLNLTPGTYHIVFSDGVTIRLNDQGYTGGSISNDGSFWINSPSAPQAAFRITAESALPVELIYFEGTATEDGVLLKWETATEVNNYGFDVERRSSSLTEWEQVRFVQGHGTTNSPKQYSFTDPLNLDLNLTRLDYRLKQIDNDGTYAYSKTITVDLTTITSVEDEVIYEFALEQNYPNPFNPSTTIKFTVPNVGDEYIRPLHTKLIVYDILGREVGTLVNQKLQPGNHEVQFDGSNLSTGMYIYRINIDRKFNSVKKMLMVK
ncbi:MAG: T9SS type A sorting domain-containing protein [Melioribacteraceae bacterium]|nr:MAG: T9SS type A sorting domain-containing protein [Melioribacteraceae bacterium]